MAEEKTGETTGEWLERLEKRGNGRIMQGEMIGERGRSDMRRLGRER